VTLLELTGAFAPFSNGGYYVEPYLIRRIKDMEGKVLYERSAIPDTLVVREREVGMINHMLANVVTSGTGRNAALGPREVAGKTGTSQNSRDGLFIGYTADLVTGVWFGNDDGSPMSKVTGGSLPATSWHEFMVAAHEGLPLTPLPGNYVPEPVTASIPQLVPNSGNGSVNGGGDRSIGQILEQERPSDRRRSLSEIDGGVRPPANIGQEQERPRNILDLLFGRN
jgi:penicillin-binding protein 1A